MTGKMKRMPDIFSPLPRVMGLFLLLCVFGVLLRADDQSATETYRLGREAFLSGDHRGAARKFVDSEILAESPVIKANSLKAQIAAYRMCQLPFMEFEAIEKLLINYPENADFVGLVNREYELGEMFYQGVREPAFWALRFIPWLLGPDKSMDIYQKALERAPFAASAPAARLRLAYLLDQKGKLKESLKQLRVIIKDFPKAPEAKYALLALGNGLFNLAEHGDGDGRYVRECIEVLQQFEEKYPDVTENEWVKRHLLMAQDIQAKRLYNIAEFYGRAGKKETSARYLAKVLRDYPESLSAQPAEKMLVKMDNTFIPGDFQERPQSRLQTYKAYELPKEATSLLIVPANSDRKYLLPIYDLRLGVVDAKKEVAK